MSLAGALGVLGETRLAGIAITALNRHFGKGGPEGALLPQFTPRNATVL